MTDAFTPVFAEYRKTLVAMIEKEADQSPAHIAEVAASFFEHRVRGYFLMQPEKLQWMREYEKSLNARVSVEEVLTQVGAGKRPMLTREECARLSVKLGVPQDFGGANG